MNMKKSCRWKGRIRIRLAEILLCAILILLLPGSVYADGAYHEVKSRAIAIVFDNSGSMYSDGNKAWSQATYAMEVFAAMLNDGDILQIYPMGEITAGGRKYSDTNPLEVSGGGNISLIQDIFTPQTVDTPISTIRRAHDGILKTQADEKWLVVLTDGNKFYGDDPTDSSKRTGLPELGDTRAELTKMFASCVQDMNVIYLGIGSQTSMPDDTAITPSGKFQYSQQKTNDSAEVTTRLADACNQIFGRDELPVDNGNMTFDIPMKKIILFVQGTGIEQIDFGSGLQAVNSYAPHYPTNGGGDSGNYTTDENLSGLINVYENIPAGTYPISYSGQATSVTAYYEPDVDMAVSISNTQGEDVSGSGSLTEGVYHVHAELQDPEGNPTASPLLKTISYQMEWEDANGNVQTAPMDQNGNADITFRTGQTLNSVQVEGTYLTNYHIVKTAKDLGWTFDGSVVGTAPLTLDVTGGSRKITLSGFENADPYRIAVSFNGTHITGEQLKNVGMTVRFSDPAVTGVFEAAEDVWNLKLSSDDKSKIDTGSPITGTVQASYTDPSGVQAAGSAELLFSVTNDAWTDVKMKITGADRYHKKFLFLKDQLTDDKADTYTVTLTKNDGELLTEDDLSTMTLSAEAEGTNGSIPVTVEQKPGYSGWKVTLNGSKNTRAGKYTLTARAAGTNNVGNQIDVSGQKQISVERVPRIVRLLLVIFIAVLLILLISWWRSRKILPRGIDARIANGGFIVDGDAVSASIHPDFSGGNQNIGSFSVKMPRYPMNPLIRGGIGMNLKAVSPRRMKSSQRHAQMTAIPRIQNLGGMQSVNLRVGNAEFLLDEDTHKMIRAGIRSDKPVEVDIHDKTHVDLVATFSDGTSVSFGCILIFR